MVTISEKMGDLGITITNHHIFEVEKLVVHFATKKTHPLVLGGPYLGIDPMYFLPADYNALFDIFDISKKEVEKLINEIPSINKSFNVISDPLNILSMWLCHLATIYIKDKQIRYNFMTNVLRYYHYRIFCSAVNNFFRHGTNRGIMEATVESLTKKSSIIRVGSWDGVIREHIEKILDPKDRFYQTIVEGHPDEDFLQVISESQTMLRTKMRTFANAYYETHASGGEVKSSSSIAQNSDGEKIIAQTASVIESTKASMVSELLNPKIFVHDISVDLVAKLSTNVSSRFLRTALLKINEVAVLQVSSRTLDKIEKTKEGTVYVGVRALMVEIIHSTIRVCRTRKINLGNRAKVFEEMRKIYSSSRISDEGILSVKRSLSHLMDDFNITSNEASKAALRLSVVYYIIYRMIEKMKV